MYMDLNVSTIYTFDSNACVIDFTSTQAFDTASDLHLSTELTFIMEVTFALRYLHHYIHALTYNQALE
jgi:hypothetical protein